MDTTALAKQLWKHTLAIGAFGDALVALEELEIAVSHGNFRILQPLWIAYFISYSKPFTNNDLGFVSDKIVPAEFKKLHKFTLALRHKTYGHTDHSVTLDSGVGINVAQFHVKGPAVYPNPTSIMPAPDQIPEFTSMVKAVHRSLIEKSAHLFENLPDFQDLSDGDYLFEWQKPDGERLLKISKG